MIKKLVAWLKQISYLINAVAVFVAVLFFHAITMLSFWDLLQGRDMVSCVSENWLQMIVAGFGTTLWSITFWFCARLLAYSRNDIYLSAERTAQTNSNAQIVLKIWQHLPRFFGSACYYIAIGMVLKMTRFDHEISFSWLFVSMAVANILLYAAFNGIFRKYRARWKNRAKRSLILAVVLMLVVILLPGAYAWLPYENLYLGMTITITCLTVGSFIFQVLVAMRRDWFEALGNLDHQPWQRFEWLYQMHREIVVKVLKDDQDASVPNETRQNSERNIHLETIFLLIFNLIVLFGVGIYLATLISQSAASTIGGMPIVLLAFSLIMGAVNIIQILSRKTKVKYFLFIILAAILLGKFFDPHKMKIIENDQAKWDQRVQIDAYLDTWLEKRVSNDSTFHVYCVMANGGASRSGFWVAEVLRMLHDTCSDFRNNLLALSGASGGSVGTATYYAQRMKHGSSSLPVDEHRNFLGTDFLSHTIATMLGTDLLNVLCPILPFNDRSAALENAMMNADDPGKIDSLFRQPFSSVATDDAVKRAELPLLFINTTRMQDGKPCLFTNVQYGDDFSLRSDIGADMQKMQYDISLAGAVVNGARFPFISPAGRLTLDADHEKKEIYLVDGGYFDNSGGGIIHELLIALKKKMADKYPGYKLSMRVVHITNSRWNSPGHDRTLKRVSPLINDLAAPVVTLAGSYSMQTNVNDSRLKRYLEDEGNSLYLQFPLLDPDTEDDEFTMNWLISKHLRNRMIERCNPDTNAALKSSLDALMK